jgi:multidrug transporter EmrE-like cation transporter
MLGSFSIDKVSTYICTITQGVKLAVDCLIKESIMNCTSYTFFLVVYRCVGWSSWGLSVSAILENLLHWTVSCLFRTSSSALDYIFHEPVAILEMAFDALRKQLAHCLHAIEIHMQHFLECTMSIDERHSTLGYKVSYFRLLIIVPWMSMYLLSVSSLSLPFSYAYVLWHLKFCTFILQAFDSKTCSVEYNHCHIYFHILLMLLLNSCSYASFQNTYSLLKTSYNSCT